MVIRPNEEGRSFWEDPMERASGHALTGLTGISSDGGGQIQTR
jgi:hypothetical protein